MDTFQDSVLPTPLIAQRSWLQVKRSEGIMSTALSPATAASAASPAARSPLKLIAQVLPIALSLWLGGATAWYSMHQSLWIDELHTAWSSTGSWEEILPRAAIGNQTPLYFLWQWCLGRTFGQSEVCLRATSLVAWFGSLALFTSIIRLLVSRPSHRALWYLMCLAALDRQQIFFATEARPYMLMSLVLLLGWLALDAWLTPGKPEHEVTSAAQSTNELAARSSWAWIGWQTCCVMAMWLQPTAVLFVAAQFAWALWSGINQRARRRSSTLAGIAIGLLLLAGLVWPMRYVLEPAWHGRQAWTAFAADLRWSNVLRQLPILVVAVPGAIAWVVSVFNPGFTSDRRAGMFLVAWLLPLMIVIGLTAAGIAPLMHARYLFAATLPMTLWCALMLSRLPSRWITVTILSLIVAQAIQQGSARDWLAGRLSVVTRGEGWREAIEHINCQAANDEKSVTIYCASNLIEGSRADYLTKNELSRRELAPVHSHQLSAGSLREEYLSLPLRTLYGVTQRARIVALLNDPRSWRLADSAVAETQESRWLIVRTSPSGLAKRLTLSGLRPLEQLDFGTVQLVRF